MKLISVIIPVYNTSKYLSRCLDSLINQTFSDIELIIVNDGSTDNSLEIIREYEKKDSRIVVVDKNNEGVSVARNTGIELAKGKYIMFCDSDDFVADDWISILYNFALQYPKSLIDCEYYNYDCDSGTSTIKRLGDYTNTCKIPIDEYYLYYKNQYSNTCWNRIYRKELLHKNNIRFPKDISVGEDVLFNIEYLKYCNSFYHVTVPLYYWNNENRDSLSRKPDVYYYDIIKRLYFPRLSVVSEKDRQEFIDESFYRFYICLEDLMNLNNDKNNIRYGRYILKDKEFNHTVKNASPKACGSKLRMILNLQNLCLFALFLRIRRWK